MERHEIQKAVDRRAYRFRMRGNESVPLTVTVTANTFGSGLFETFLSDSVSTSVGGCKRLGRICYRLAIIVANAVRARGRVERRCTTCDLQAISLSERGMVAFL
jgi:hypothetical protein